MIAYFKKTFTLKDLSIICACFFGVFLSIFIFLLRNNAYISNLQLVSQVFALVIYILLGFNLSYIIYILVSKPNNLINFLAQMSSNKMIGKFVREIVILNILALFNLTLLTICNIITVKIIQVVLLSVSLGIWPIIILFLLSMDAYLDKCAIKKVAKKETKDARVHHAR
jgi:hypothetical protein